MLTRCNLLIINKLACHPLAFLLRCLVLKCLLQAVWVLDKDSARRNRHLRLVHLCNLVEFSDRIVCPSVDKEPSRRLWANEGSKEGYVRQHTEEKRQVQPILAYQHEVEAAEHYWKGVHDVDDGECTRLVGPTCALREPNVGDAVLYLTEACQAKHGEACPVAWYVDQGRLTDAVEDLAENQRLLTTILVWEGKKETTYREANVVGSDHEADSCWSSAHQIHLRVPVL